MTVRAGRLFLALAVVFGLGRVLYAAWEQDVTYDEPYHLRWSERLLDRGLAERESNSLWNSKTPMSVPYVLAGRAAKALGVRSARGLTFATRLPGVAFYLLLVLGTYSLTRCAFGAGAAVLAAAAIAVEPSVVGNAPLATVDVPYAVGVTLALLAALRWIEHPQARAASGLGLALGLAFVAKFSAFTLLPVFAILPALVPRERRPRAMRVAGHAALVTAACLCVIAAAYFFKDLGRPWRRIPFHAQLFQDVAARFPELRAPLPAAFITGVDRTFSHERSRDWAVVVLGQVYAHGAPHYFLVSWAVKTPLALLVLQFIGVWGLWRGRLARGAAFWLLAWAFAFQWIYFSFFMRAQIGYRFALMLLPVAFALAAAGFVAVFQRPRAAAMLLVLAGVETLPYAGNDLAFTNALVLPKKDAFKYIAGSSLDYGQNEEKVGPWLKGQPWKNPHFEPNHVRPGINVIGVNALTGVATDRPHRWLREHVEPLGHFRHSYLWFDVDAATYERLLEEDRHLTASPEDAAACAGGQGHSVDPATWKHFPRQKGTRAWRVCFEAGARVDVGLIDKGGGLNLGRREWKLRDWDRFRAGEEAWYRLDPGVHSLVALQPGEFRGRFRVNGGPLRIWMLPEPDPFPRVR
jgi:Dolichyl-phosphate-mannose-protein mannosyltransferase